MHGFVVCQENSDIGLGHFSRMLVLAHAFKRQQRISVKLFIQGPVVVKPELALVQHQFIAKRDSFFKLILQAVHRDKPTVIILDIPVKQVTDVFIDFLKQLRSLAIKIIGIDNLDYSNYCDMVHIPAFWVNPSKLTHVQCPVIYGWDSYLLAPPKKHKSWKPGNKIIILTGGSDVAKLGETLPCELDAMLPLGLKMHWIKGPYANTPHLPSVPRLSWIIEDSPENLVGLMGEMHYALTVFGVSFFELLRTGIPTVVFSPYGNKDQAELTKINEENLCYVVKNQKNAIQSLVKLMNNTDEAHLFSERSQHKIHINGTEKLIDQIASLVSES